MTSSGEPIDRQHIHDDLERARADLHDLVAHATAADLRRRTRGTNWTNGQLLWHMVFGYVIVLRLLPLVRIFGRLPDRFSLTFAGALNAATRPFHHINYLGSVCGALVFRGPQLAAQLDRTIAQLHIQLDAEADEALDRHMHFPGGWDPFFHDSMTLA